MRQLYLCAFAAMICANGCRTAGNVSQVQPLGGRLDQYESQASTVIDSSNRDAVSTEGQGDPRQLKRLPGSNASTIQPVAFQQGPNETSAMRPEEELPMPEATLEDSLTLLQLEQIAMASNPSLAEASAWVEAARGRWVQVGLPPNTVLGYSGQQLGSGGLAEQQGLYVAQELVRGGKLRLNREVMLQEIQKSEQSLAAQRQRVLTDVRLAYYEVLVAQLRNATADRLVEIAKEAIEAAESLFKAQEVSKVDVMRARIELQSAQLARRNAANRYTATWSRLVAVLGVPDMRSRPLVGELERTIDEIDSHQALKRLLSESPEMAAAMTEVERARWSVDRAYAEPVPNVEIQAIVQSDNGTGGSNANLQVSVPIPWLNRNQGGIRQARAEVVAAERAIDRLALSFQQRLAGVYQRYANARNQVDEYSKDNGILANSQSTLDFVRRAYQSGELGYLDLITAQRTYSQTNLAYIESLGELWAAIIEIDGLLLKGSLDSASIHAQ